MASLVPNVTLFELATRWSPFLEGSMYARSEDELEKAHVAAYLTTAALPVTPLSAESTFGT